MSARLTTDMYAPKFRGQERSELFGLRNGQMPEGAITHNSYWFSKAGSFLGHGDMTPDNFQDIAAGLLDGEVWLVVSQSDACPHHGCERPGPYGHSLGYLSEHAQYAIVRDKIFVCGSDRRVDGATPIAPGQIYRLLNAAKGDVTRLADSF